MEHMGIPLVDLNDLKYPLTLPACFSSFSETAEVIRNHIGSTYQATDKQDGLAGQ